MVSIHSQIAEDASVQWQDYQKRYVPVYKRLKQEVDRLTQPLPIPPASSGDERLQTLRYVEAHGLASLSSVGTSSRASQQDLMKW